MSDAFVELDEAIKQERLEKIWKQYRLLIIGALASIIIGTASFQSYHAWNISVEQKQTSIILHALEKDNAAQILNEVASDLRPNLRGIALLSAGGAFIEDNNTEEALKAYTQASQDTSIPAELRDLATIMSIQLANKNPQEESTRASLSKLKAIWSNDKSPWALQARLQTALILAHQSNDYEGAIAQLNVITETQNVPNSMRAKAGALKHVYSLQRNDK